MDLEDKQEWNPELFYKKVSEIPSVNYTPEKLSQIFKQLELFTQPRVMLDTEHGIDGTYCKGSCEVWNTYEFSPWKILKPVTVVMGNLNYSDDDYESGKSNRNLANLEITNGSKVFVSGNLTLGNLFITNGQLHCLGEVIVTHHFLASGQSYVHAKKISANSAGIFGNVNCKSIHHSLKINSEKEGLSLRSSNAEIRILKK